MAVQVSYPGVYIEEFAPGAPIQGVGTSTAAFLGPAALGPLNEPIRVTSWDQFRQMFGELPLPGFYLWYSVRGYFENGGRTCYVTRVSNAAHDALVLDDGGGDPVIRLRARAAGDLVQPIAVTIAPVSVVASTAGSVPQPTATVQAASGGVVTVTNSAQAAAFVPGDAIEIDGTAIRGTVTRVEGADIRFTGAISPPINAGTVQLISLAAADRTFRMASTGGVPEIGMTVQLTQDATTAAGTIAAVNTERPAPGVTAYRVTLEQPLGAAFDLTAAGAAITVQSFEFDLTVTQGAASTTLPRLSMGATSPRFYLAVINAADVPIVAEPAEPPNTTAAPDNIPAALADEPLAGGTDDDPAALTGAEYRAALAGLEEVRGVNMLVVPDRGGDVDVQTAMIAHAEAQRRFAILGAPRSAPPFGAGSVEALSATVTSARGYGALYYPWLLVPPAAGNVPVLVPPMGHIAGIYARTDVNRGVHKAPAGEEATVNGVLGVERNLTDTDQGLLNLGEFAGIGGINVVRVFRPGGRAVVWGARTTATDRNWQYVNVRRLFIFLEDSIEEGIRWAVFEPNNLQLWQKLKRTLNEFLDRQWRDGALFGAKADEAYYVRIDEALNPFSEQALGRLHIEIGVRPTYPAEFIVVRIGIWQGGSEVSEG